MFYTEEIAIQRKREREKIIKFLEDFDLVFEDVDLCIGLYNDKNKLIGTCSKKDNLIKCLAIKPEYEQQELANQLVSAILTEIYQTLTEEVFVITKDEYRDVFTSMNFAILYENNTICFLTTRLDKFIEYQNYLAKHVKPGVSGAIILNANPFTLGHEYLIECASKQVDNLFVIPVWENTSFFTYRERKEMIGEGIKKFKNVKMLEGSEYLVSKATFPSYFLKSPEKVIYEQTNLDANIFVKLFKEPLNVHKRFVGTEPISETTKIYNNVLKEVLEKNRIELIEIPRLEIHSEVVSASTVRALLAKGKIKEASVFLPKSTLTVFEHMDFKSRVKEHWSKLYKDN